MTSNTDDRRRERGASTEIPPLLTLSAQDRLDVETEYPLIQLLGRLAVINGSAERAANSCAHIHTDLVRACRVWLESHRALTLLGVKPPELPERDAIDMVIDAMAPGARAGPIGGDLGGYAERRGPEPDVREALDAMTPDHLAKRPGQLLQEACTYAMGNIAADPAMWELAADQFQKLLAKGAKPEPTDLPMDGTDADDRALLEMAVRALEDFGEERALAPGGYKADRAARMEAAKKVGWWLRQIVEGKAKVVPDFGIGDELSATFTLSADQAARWSAAHYAAGLERASTDAQVAEDQKAGWATSHFLFDANQRLQPAPAGARYEGRLVLTLPEGVEYASTPAFDLRADNGELPVGDDNPVPPMVGDWDYVPHNPRMDGRPVDPETWVVVSNEQGTTGFLAKAGDRCWSDREDVDSPIRWWRRASEREVALGHALPNKHTDRQSPVDPNPGPKGATGETRPARGPSPTWEDHDRLADQMDRVIGLVDRLTGMVEQALQPVRVVMRDELEPGA